MGVGERRETEERIVVRRGRHQDVTTLARSLARDFLFLEPSEVMVVVEN
jgi:hypothetical protein